LLLRWSASFRKHYQLGPHYRYHYRLGIVACCVKAARAVNIEYPNLLPTQDL